MQESFKAPHDAPRVGDIVAFGRNHDGGPPQYKGRVVELSTDRDGPLAGHMRVQVDGVGKFHVFRQHVTVIRRADAWRRSVSVSTRPSRSCQQPRPRPITPRSLSPSSRPEGAARRACRSPCRKPCASASAARFEGRHAARHEIVAHDGAMVLVVELPDPKPVPAKTVEPPSVVSEVVRVGDPKPPPSGGTAALARDAITKAKGAFPAPKFSREPQGGAR